LRAKASGENGFKPAYGAPPLPGSPRARRNPGSPGSRARPGGRPRGAPRAAPSPCPGVAARCFSGGGTRACPRLKARSCWVRLVAHSAAVRIGPHPTPAHAAGSTRGALDPYGIEERESPRSRSSVARDTKQEGGHSGPLGWTSWNLGMRFAPPTICPPRVIAIRGTSPRAHPIGHENGSRRPASRSRGGAAHP
jgi:hypothetical protein